MLRTTTTGPRSREGSDGHDTFPLHGQKREGYCHVSRTNTYLLTRAVFRSAEMDGTYRTILHSNSYQNALPQTLTLIEARRSHAFK